MGTKADFYIGVGEDAKWIGSVDQDGYPDAIPAEILIQINEIMFEELVVEFLQSRKPRSYISSEGDKWPWLWSDSRMTDYAYIFFQARVVMSHYGKEMIDPIKIVQGEDVQAAALHLYPPGFPIMNPQALEQTKRLYPHGPKTSRVV